MHKQPTPKQRVFRYFRQLKGGILRYDKRYRVQVVTELKQFEDGKQGYVVKAKLLNNDDIPVVMTASPFNVRDNLKFAFELALGNLLNDVK